jgi:hypothetical protein
LVRRIEALFATARTQFQMVGSPDSRRVRRPVFAQPAPVEDIPGIALITA